MYIKEWGRLAKLKLYRIYREWQLWRQPRSPEGVLLPRHTAGGRRRLRESAASPRATSTK